MDDTTTPQRSHRDDTNPEPVTPASVDRSLGAGEHASGADTGPYGYGASYDAPAASPSASTWPAGDVPAGQQTSSMSAAAAGQQGPGTWGQHVPAGQQVPSTWPAPAAAAGQQASDTWRAQDGAPGQQTQDNSPAHDVPSEQAGRTDHQPTHVFSTTHVLPAAGDAVPPPPGGSYAVGAAPAGSRRRRGDLAALAVAGCLVAGTAGGALGAQLADDDSTVTTRSAGSTSAAPASVVDGTVQAAAAAIIPSTVVISITSNQGEGTGSGVVMDTDGSILTNAHVVNGLPGASIEVTFSDGRTVPAEVVGVDESSDLAVIDVDDVDGLQPATFADSDALVIGQTVVAVGAPLGLSGTVTEGIVSAVDRPVRTGESADASTVLDAVQTDASINPGNSGGPLVNLAGEVVGINSAIATVGASAGQAGSIGVGFAIPSNDATDIAAQLLEDGTAEHASLGISASEAQSGTGALVQRVENGSGADAAGLQQGDLITRLDDRAVVDLDSLLASVRDHAPGAEVTLAIVRNGSEETLTVTLGSREG